MPRKMPAVATLALPDIGYTGVETNHSSTVPSTDHEGLDPVHAQADDEINNYPDNVDPNLAGLTATEDTVSWLAGPMSGWVENDDYRDFFETGDWPVSRLQAEYKQRDGDYDDNGGIATAIGHGDGQFTNAPRVETPGVSLEQAGHPEHAGAWFLGKVPERI